MTPSEVVIHAVKASFDAGSLVVEEHHVQHRRAVVVGKDATIDILPVEDIGLAVFTQSSLYHKPIALFLKKCRERDGCQLTLLVV